MFDARTMLHLGAVVTAFGMAALGDAALRGELAFVAPRRLALLELRLRFLRSPVRALPFHSCQLLWLAGGACLTVFHPSTGLVVVALGLTPGPLLAWLQRRRVEVMERQIEGWLGSLSRALEAAPSLGDALASSVAMVDAPLRDELEEAVLELGLGSPLSRALAALGARVGSSTLTMALVTMEVGRTTGGRLPDVLRSAAGSLREMARLQGVLRTKTAEGRTQAIVISLVPAPLYLGVRAIDPLYFVPLESSAVGHVILGGAVALWLLSGIFAQRILAVDL